MAAGAGAIKAADDVRHFGMGRNDAVRQAPLLQEGGDKPGGVARVARGVGAGMPYEGVQEVHEIAAVAIDPLKQLLTPRVHLDLPRSRPNGAAAAAWRPPCTDPTAAHSQALFLCPRSPMLAGQAISGSLVKLQTRRQRRAAYQEPKPTVAGP